VNKEDVITQQQFFFAFNRFIDCSWLAEALS
jgi:hypothetical protein